MPKPVDSVKKQVDLQVQRCTAVQQQFHSFFEDSLAQLNTICDMLENNQIKIKFGGADTKAGDIEQACTQSDTISVDNEPKKRGRPRKEKSFSEESDKDEVLSDNSTSSIRGQRAAAQAAGQKMVQVQNFMKATKLRRPADFDEKRRRCDKAAAPPAKSRKTNKKQSAGSSQDTNEINDVENKENNLHSESEVHSMDSNMVEVDYMNCADLCLKNKCTISLENLTNSVIKSHKRSRSLDSPLYKNTSPIKDNGLSERMNIKTSIKVHDTFDKEIKSDSEVIDAENEVRSRTKVIKKHDVSEGECRSRTKTIKKGIECNDLESTNLAEISKEHLLSENKLTAEACNGSPLMPKRAVVKKIMEEFETLGKKDKETTGVITRRTAKNRNLASQAITPENSAKTRAHKVNKKLANCPVPIEHSAAVVQKEPLEEIEKKRKEEERQKRQVKEEVAIKKKDNALKATIEEAIRKREEKIKKAAATREALERGKRALFCKAEKNKEAKMLQIAAEKEKHKDEHLKMKQLTKQKALEHEERRRQEKEVRLARLKGQEEEHKQILAMGEREVELKKQDSEIRLAEREKSNYTGIELCKAASSNCANAKLKQVMNLMDQQPCQSYEITPARDERPLLPPKSENDYGIDHAKSGDDSSEDESHPKKKIPLWADAKTRNHLLQVNALIPKEIWPLFMESIADPDVNKIFAGNPIRNRVRTSSAVWETPPRS